MSLGVLNNISAIYAENNLNQTSASLQNTLTQLSSGSRINSGADDAAGLSLADGLGANSAALTQSATNASSGVGLLQVADGALSQVTNLLNRAVTLATEASNGTLNSSQDAAANQEYQSILAEVNNIGSTSSYNGVAVFGSSTAIFTGDASALGSSVDTLNIKSLTSASLGDVGGTMVRRPRRTYTQALALLPQPRQPLLQPWVSGGATGTSVRCQHRVRLQHLQHRRGYQQLQYRWHFRFSAVSGLRFCSGDQRHRRGFADVLRRGYTITD